VPCAKNQCKNGAKCINGLETYACNCSDGYSGQYCEIGKINFKL
jgi:hypothetical protein